MKKKIIIVIILLLCANIAFASLASIAIKRLLPKSGVWTNITNTSGNLVGATFSLPASVAAVSSAGLTALKWASLVLPAGNVARLTCVALGIAGSLAADYVINNAPEWFKEKKITKDALGGYDQTLSRTVYYPADTALRDQFWTWGASNLNANDYTLSDVKYYSDSATALAGAQTDGYTHAIDGSWWPRVTGFGYRCYGVKALADADPKRVRISCFPENGYSFASKTEDYLQKIYLNDIKTQLESDIITGNSNARKVGQTALMALANAMDNPEGNPLANHGEAQRIFVESLTDAQKGAIEQSAVDADTIAENEGKIANSLSPEQIQKAVEAALIAQGLTSSQIAALLQAVEAARVQNLTPAQTVDAVQNALKNQNLSADKIAAAIAALNPALKKTDVAEGVKSALLDDAGVTIPNDIADMIAPDKLSLTTVMQSFFNSLNNLPILQTLRGLTINAGGSSSLCVNMPANLGGTKCFNCSGIQSDLNTAGSAILSICSIISFIYIFKG